MADNKNQQKEEEGERERRRERKEERRLRIVTLLYRIYDLSQKKKRELLSGHRIIRSSTGMGRREEMAKRLN